MDGQTERIRARVSDLLCWYDAHRRPLPFRDDPTPYRVWVSEIMLQQTRIEAVLPRYEKFMHTLPSVAALAAVPDEQLLKLWEGLGYYSRARHLKQAANQIMERHGGALPADYAALRALAGIGDYTAGAIASIAFGIAVPAVDGNVLRVLARLLCYEEDVLSPRPRRYLSEIAASLVPNDRPGAFNEAMMELGETVCLPNGAPRCAACPFAAVCAARANSKAEALPVRLPKTTRRVERRTVFTVVTASPRRVLLHKRADKGLLAGLWELPNVEGDGANWADTLGLTVLTHERLADATHLFSHIEWKMSGVRLTVKPSAVPEEYVWADAASLQTEYALPSAFRAYAAPLTVWLKGE